MSHYTVAVITKDGNYEKALEPFNERIVVEPYIYKTKDDIIKDMRENMEEARSTDNKNWISWLEGAFDWSSDEALHQSYVRHYKDECGVLFDNDGNELSIYNPKSKWDWYEVGGRWSGDILRTKDGEKTDHDQAKNLDFAPKAMSQDDFLYYKRYWEINAEGDARKGDEKTGDYFCLWKPEYMKEIYGDFKGYIEAITNPSTHSLLYHGEWIEAGEVIGFGLDKSTPLSRQEYEKKYKEIMSNLDPDNYITIIDCHI